MQATRLQQRAPPGLRVARRRPLSRDLHCRATQLVLYSKQECPLCAGLQEKLRALQAKAQFAPGFWADVELEVWPSRAATLRMRPPRDASQQATGLHGLRRRAQ